MIAIACQECSTVSREGAKFCVKCGTRLQAPPVVCGSCGTALLPDAAFCDHCGTPVVPPQAVQKQSVNAAPTGAESVTTPAPPVKPDPPVKPALIECQKCAHHRPATEIASRIGGLSKGADQVALARADIRKEEMELRAAEAQERVDLIMNAQIAWSHAPVLEPYCASQVSKDVFGLCEVKNRAGNCSEFEPKAERKVMACGDCKHRRVPNPNETYPDPVDIEPFQAMIKVRDADQATELKYAWSSKGWLNFQPVFQQHCPRIGLITGKGMGVLPYVNSRNDCAHHESDGFSFEGKVAAVGVVDDEMVIFASKWMKVYRTQGPQELVALCAATMKTHSSGPMRELVEDLASIGATSCIAIGAVGLGMELMKLSGPESRARAGGATSLGNRMLGCNIMIAHLPANTPAEEITEALLQTIAEQFCLEHWAPEGQFAFCRAERLRIEHGMYPDQSEEPISKLLKEIELRAKAFERGNPAPSDVGYHTLVAELYPISYKLLFEQAQIHLPSFNVGQPVPFRELKAHEKEALARFAAGHLEASTISILHAFANDNYATANNILAAFRRVANSDRTMESGLTWAFKFEQAAILCLRVANHIGRVVLPTEHVDVRVEAMDTPGVPRWLENLRQNDPIWLRAVEQKTASLFNVRVGRYAAARAQAAVQK